MSLVQIIILLAVALLAAVACMLFVPRQKRALPFEIVMWLSAWVVAALSAWLTWGAVQSLASLSALALLPIAGIPIVPISIGAFGGALVLTLPLWFMDRFGSESEPEEN